MTNDDLDLREKKIFYTIHIFLGIFKNLTIRKLMRN